MEEANAPLQVITVNGQEYNPEDASQLIELGNKWKETESRLNTSLDKVFPEYTKATQEAAQLRKDLEERDRRLAEFQTKQKEAEIPQDTKAALEAARALGLADRDYLKEQGYVRKEDLDSYFAEKQSQQQLVENVMKQANKLESEIDGSDGRVPFNQKAVLAYASAYNIQDLKAAYEEMNEGANKAWQERQLAEAKRPGMTTLKGGGVKTPEPVKITNDNFQQALAEALGE